MAFDHERLEVGAGAVEGGGVTGASGAHDYDIAYVHSRDVDPILRAACRLCSIETHGQSLS
jgi:phosphoheptose isomerase